MQFDHNLLLKRNTSAKENWILIATDLNQEFLDKKIIFWVCFSLGLTYRPLGLKEYMVLRRWYWWTSPWYCLSVAKYICKWNGWKRSRDNLYGFDRTSSQSYRKSSSLSAKHLYRWRYSEKSNNIRYMTDDERKD